MPSPTAEPNDAELVQRSCSGDVEAFGQLVRRYQERVYMLALQMTHNHSDADELSQAAFLRAFEALGSFRSESGFLTWIHRITVNLCLTHLKNRQRWLPIADSEGEENEKFVPTLASSENLETQSESAEASEQVWLALAKLSPELRAAAVLVYLHDMSPKDAGRTLGCAEATVHWRLFKARKILKGLLS